MTAYVIGFGDNVVDYYENLNQKFPGEMQLILL